MKWRARTSFCDGKGVPDHSGYNQETVLINVPLYHKGSADLRNIDFLTSARTFVITSGLRATSGAPFYGSEEEDCNGTGEDDRKE